ncbi:hypothetical protein BGZ60DRAFT_457495 [Tricladium varicosporioides]|nr:hypothetical protein BGZ60DRAFT_457495 [Hymenoscyphus varicosporioides]
MNLPAIQMLHLISMRSAGPYPSNTAGLGGVPIIAIDVPVCTIFIALYLSLAVTNSVIFRKNRRNHHKFILSVLLTGFCMARVGTLVLRIVWATRQHNIRLAIAAQIFVNAGILVVYIVNLILAQRILRAKQPHIGWHPALRVIYKLFFIGIAAALVMVIVSVVVSLYTLNTHTRVVCRDIQLAALTYLLVFTCLPLIHIVAAFLLPRVKEENFGWGGMATKVLILTLSACLCTLISGFKAGVTWSSPRRATNPAWYDSKACFYVFNFTLEIIILCVLTFGRIDKRFFVPNGSNRPGDYSRRPEKAEVEIDGYFSEPPDSLIKQPEKKENV